MYIIADRPHVVHPKRQTLSHHLDLSAEMKLSVLLIAFPWSYCSAFVLVPTPTSIINRRESFRHHSSHSSSSCHFIAFKQTCFARRPRQTAAVAGAGTKHSSHRRGCFPMTALSASGLAAVAVSASSAVVVLVVGLVGLSVASVVEGGVRGDLGASQEDILGVPAEDATAADVARLGKAAFMQLFYASRCPAEDDLDGEYLARTLDTGMLHPVASFIVHRIWGPGRWLGKAFQTGSPEGYNLFSASRTAPSSESSNNAEGLPEDTLRGRCFHFSIFSGSVFDRGESSTLNYGGGVNSNGPLFGGMRDEVRKVNDQLFVGLGYIKAFGGKYSTAPFVIEGPPVGKFSGPDVVD